MAAEAKERVDKWQEAFKPGVRVAPSTTVADVGGAFQPVKYEGSSVSSRAAKGCEARAVEESVFMELYKDGGALLQE